MSTTVELWGVNHEVPATGETGWGSAVSTFLINKLDGMDGLSFKLTGNAIVFALETVTDSTLAASATLTPTAPAHRVQGSGGAVTLDATTAIADGASPNQLLKLEGAHATNTVTILDGANTDLNGLVTLALGEAIEIMWDPTRSVWQEQGRST